MSVTVRQENVELELRNPHSAATTISACADSFQILLELANHVSLALDCGGYNLPDEKKKACWWECGDRVRNSLD